MTSQLSLKRSCRPRISECWVGRTASKARRILSGRRQWNVSMEDRMKRRFVPVVIVGSMVLLAGLNSRRAHSEPPPACASGAEGDAAKVAATQILQSLMAAYEKLKRDFGDDILSSRKAEIDTPQGTRTIGQVWNEYLKQTGYPAFAVR